MDIVARMAEVVRQAGHTPFLLSQYPSLVLPRAEEAGLKVDGYGVPLNRDWSWFTRDACLEAVRATRKPVIAFMPLASGQLKKDVRGALEWLYAEAGVESILYGTATAEHARETTRIAREAREASDSIRKQRSES
jgi:aryl-alcohol dehydrogenase-like predicted oxidoreductase